MQVNFVIAGTQKAGTTSLDAYLRQHPQIAMARKKELRFFDQDDKPLDYAAYEASFDAKPDAVAQGESTPSYIYWPSAPGRLHAYNPAMKVISLLRNPIARAFSQWRMEVERGDEDTDFSSAIRTEAGRLAISNNRMKKRRSYVDRGRYGVQIKRLLRTFPRDQLFFVKTEDFSEDRDGTVSDVLDFLGVDNIALDTSTRFKTTHYAGKMPEEDRVFLRDAFADDTAVVERLLGWDCSDWR
jgi:hypothetical protein